VYQDSPPDPPAHAFFSVFEAARETVPPAQDTNASLHTGPEREGPLEAGLFFVLLAFLGKTTALRQGHAPNTRPLGDLLAFE
jgi:hypothetical protein